MAIIGIIGSNGVVGSSLVTNLAENNIIVEITKESYSKVKKMHLEFDILINANGNPSKMLANDHPILDLQKSVESVYHYLNDFKCKSYIYISSIDILFESTYGLHKQFAESIVTSNYNNYTCLRLGAVVSKNAKKGLVYDIFNYKEVGVTKDSRVQLIHTKDIAKIINKLLTLKKWKPFYNCWSIDCISPTKIASILERPIKYGDSLKKQLYNVEERNTIYLNKSCLEVLESLKGEIDGN